MVNDFLLASVVLRGDKGEPINSISGAPGPDVVSGTGVPWRADALDPQSSLHVGMN